MAAAKARHFTLPQHASKWFSQLRRPSYAVYSSAFIVRPNSPIPTNYLCGAHKFQCPAREKFGIIRKLRTEIQTYSSRYTVR